MKNNIVKIGIILVVMVCMFNVVVNAVGTLPKAVYMPDDALVGPTKVQANSDHTTMIIIRLIQALLPVLVMFLAVIRLIINLVKIKKIQNEEEKSKKKTRTVIELCIWIGVFFLVNMLLPIINIYIAMNRTIM